MERPYERPRRISEILAELAVWLPTRMGHMARFLAHRDHRCEGTILPISTSLGSRYSWKLARNYGRDSESAWTSVFGSNKNSVLTGPRGRRRPRLTRASLPPSSN